MGDFEAHRVVEGYQAWDGSLVVVFAVTSSHVTAEEACGPSSSEHACVNLLLLNASQAADNSLRVSIEADL